jgi:hypothetical protein
MSSCYYYEELKLLDGSLDPSVDHLYVLTMHGSSRINQIKDQISKAKVVSNITIQYNYGYKNCRKELKKQKPNYDIIHALQTSFRHALSKGYKRIMVLEDDCQFDERIRDPEVIDDLNSFFIRKDPQVYNFGSGFSIVNPLDVLLHNKHQSVLYMYLAHCVVYNQDYMQYAAHNEFKTHSPDDEFNRVLSKYMYHKPLAYQILKETENFKDGSWGTWGYLHKYFIFPIFPMNRSVQPEFDNVKLVSDYMSVILFLLIILKIKRCVL